MGKSVTKTDDTRKRRILILILSFVVPVLIYFTVLVLLKFAPNGNKTLLFMDLKGEYTEYLGSLKYIFGGDDSLFFNWSRSMGGNVVGLYAFYSGGLFAFLSTLFSVEMMPVAVMVIELLMIGLCGLTMACFLEFGVSKKKGNLSIVIFASCYALMSYNMVYANCFMWLNGCIFLPLVLLGIEQILKGKRGLLMYGALAASMINNYYTAYMICLFSVLYFLFRMVGTYHRDPNTKKSNWPDVRKAGIRYIISAVLAAMTAAPVLLTVVIDLMKGKLTSDPETDARVFYYSFGDVFKKLLPGQYDSITTDNIHPQLYAGLLALVFALLFFVMKSIKIKEKIVAFIIGAIMLISFWHVGLDSIWHGFQLPHWFPFRYAFLFGFFLVYLAYRAYDELVQERGYEKISRIIGVKRPVAEIMVCALLLLVCSIELGNNAKNYINGLGRDFTYMEEEEYDTFLRRTKPLVDEVKETDDSWYRMDKDYEFSKNDSMLLGYKGMTHYSSTYNAAVNNLSPRYGLSRGWYWSSGYGATPLMDAVFGVKYRMATRPMPSTYQEKKKNEDVSLFENTLALPLGFAAGPTVVNSAIPDNDVFTNQSNLLSMLCGEPIELYTPVEYEREDIGIESDEDDAEREYRLTFTAPDDQPMFLHLQQTEGWDGQIFVNDQYLSDCFSLETNGAFYIGAFSPGEAVTVSIRTNNANFDQAWIVSQNTTLLTEKINKLKEHSLELTSYKGGNIEGTIKILGGQVIATSLPYDDGQTVYVDGEKVEASQWAETFLAIPVSAGEHQIRVTYTPKGWNLGLLVALAGVLGAIGLFVIVPKIKNKKKED
ncbi:MAG: YfhO family protein [Eubacterium sp.]|nr:YfhO family protein [Eubacterium sp.]